jgi:uncharacterized protein involved in type VI secretion and phage assembly
MKKQQGDKTKNYSYFEEYQPIIEEDQDFITYFMEREGVEDKFEHDDTTAAPETTDKSGGMPRSKDATPVMTTRRQKAAESGTSISAKKRITIQTGRSMTSSSRNKGLSTRRTSLASDPEEMLSTATVTPKQRHTRRDSRRK